jgi:hypothetical protein
MEYKLSMTAQLLQQWTDPLSFGKRITNLERHIDYEIKVLCQFNVGINRNVKRNVLHVRKRAGGQTMALSGSVAHVYTSLQIDGNSETRSMSHFKTPKFKI